MREVTGSTKTYCRTVKFEHNTTPSTKVMAIFSDTEELTPTPDNILILIFDRATGDLLSQYTEDTSHSGSTGIV